MTAITDAREYVDATDRIYSSGETKVIVRGLLAEIDRLNDRVEQLRLHAIKYVTPFENSFADEIESRVEDLLIKHGESHAAIKIFPGMLMTIKNAMRAKRQIIHAMEQQAKATSLPAAPLPPTV